MSSSFLKRSRTVVGGSERKVGFGMDCLVDFPKPDPADVMEDLFGIFDPVKDMDYDSSIISSVFKEEPGLDELGDLSDLFLGGENEALLSTADFGCLNGLDEFKDIKADLMWSSTLDDSLNCGWAAAAAAAQQQHSSKRAARRRDVSVTLSECAEGFLAIKDMELTENLVLQGCLGGASPPALLGSGFPLMDTPTATSESDTETCISTDDDDEEIDVVTAAEDVSCRTRIRHKPMAAQQQQQQQNRTVEAGRSLLRVNRKLQQQQPQRTTIDHMNGDHSYFSMTPKMSSGPEVWEEAAAAASAGETTEPVLRRRNGVLTPTESGDEDQRAVAAAAAAFAPLTPESIDKRKIAAAVQSLIKNKQQQQQQCKDVKFRFKMRFGSGSSPQRAHFQEQQEQQHHQSLLIQQQPRQLNRFQPYSATTSSKDRAKRKSAARNAHCPPPFPFEQEQQQTVVRTPLLSAAATVVTTRAATIGGYASPSSPASSSGGGSSKKSVLSPRATVNVAEDKSREIRDLHNRMERQRRVDLKNNYDQLKDCVPSLEDVEKASKLNILNKATEYSRHLVSMDAKLRREAERENQRSHALRKRMSALVAQMDAGKRLSSGRMSMFKASRFE